MERLAAGRGRALWAARMRRSGGDQRFASGDASVAEVARDFLVNVRGMKQGGRAVEECDEGKRQAGVAVRSAPKLRGKPAFDEFEGRHVFFTSERNSPIFRDEAVVVGMGNEEIESAAASFQRRARGPDGSEKIKARAAAKQGEEIALVGKAFVERGSGGASGAGDGAHGEGFLTAFAPDMVRRVEDVAFQKSIGFARHVATLPARVTRNYILYSVKPTMYK